MDIKPAVRIRLEALKRVSDGLEIGFETAPNLLIVTDSACDTILTPLGLGVSSLMMGATLTFIQYFANRYKKNFKFLEESTLLGSAVANTLATTGIQCFSPSTLSFLSISIIIFLSNSCVCLGALLFSLLAALLEKYLNTLLMNQLEVGISFTILIFDNLFSFLWLIQGLTASWLTILSLILFLFLGIIIYLLVHTTLKEPLSFFRFKRGLSWGTLFSTLCSTSLFLGLLRDTGGLLAFSMGGLAILSLIILVGLILVNQHSQRANKIFDDPELFIHFKPMLALGISVGAAIGNVGLPLIGGLVGALVGGIIICPACYLIKLFIRWHGSNLSNKRNFKFALILLQIGGGIMGLVFGGPIGFLLGSSIGSLLPFLTYYAYDAFKAIKIKMVRASPKEYKSSSHLSSFPSATFPSFPNFFIPKRFHHPPLINRLSFRRFSC